VTRSSLDGIAAQETVRFVMDCGVKPDNNGGKVSMRWQNRDGK
jgi:hypothetical protein